MAMKGYRRPQHDDSYKCQTLLSPRQNMTCYIIKTEIPSTISYRSKIIIKNHAEINIHITPCGRKRRINSEHVIECG